MPDVPADFPQRAASSGSPSASPQTESNAGDACADGTRLSEALAGLRIDERGNADDASEVGEVQWPPWGPSEGPDAAFRVQVHPY